MILSSPRVASSSECDRCLGTGTRLKLIDGRSVGQLCICLRRRSRRAQLAIVPPKFHSPRLYRLKPDPQRHPSQAKAIRQAQKEPEASFMFLGRNETGKSHIAWALYRHAVYQRRPVVSCLVRELLADFRRVEVGVTGDEVLKTPRVTAVDLRRRGKKIFLMLQEFEKARPTEFASEMLFEVLDAARDYEHQIVITSNFTAKQLQDHWGRMDPVWGRSIMTRLQECNQVSLF